ncbi:MAG: glycosyltransferase [Candidatus Pelethousia sp.]|nr:glycosyltransferase [Candidatus Pelethousia sp.]
MKDLISIIVPVYKVEDYLHRCIDSILSQTYENIEVILVDDGSPDGCGAICDAYAAQDSRIRVIHKTNGGLSSARNAGIDIAKGDYIGFIDSDDFIAPEMYERLYAAIKAAGAEMAICNYTWVKDDGSIYEKDLLAGKIATCVLNRNNAFEALCQPCGVTYVTACNKLYKSEVLTAVRFPDGKVHEDEFTSHHFFGHCEKIACISDALYFYVQRAGSITAQYTLRNFDAFDAMLDRYYFLKERKFDSLALKTLSGSVYSLFTKIKNINSGKMLFRWLTLICKYTATILAMPTAWPFMLKRVAGKSGRGLKRYLKWIFVKTALRKTAFIKRRVILMSTPEHGNLGDHAIVYAERNILERNGLLSRTVEIPNSVYLRYNHRIQQHVGAEDLIIIDGGGNLGTLWPNEDDKIADIIHRFKNNHIIVFPQTCYYGEDSLARLERNRMVYAAAPNLTMTFRDKASYDFAVENFKHVRCAYVPDVVLAVPNMTNEKVRNGVLLCFRKDLEQMIDSDVVEGIKAYFKDQKLSFTETDTVTERTVSHKNRKKALTLKWSEFAGAGLVITDRLHGMIFAAIMGTPCIAVDNVSKKVSGVYTWIKDLPYIRVLENYANMIENIPEMYSVAGFPFTYKYPGFFDEVLNTWGT